MENENYLKRFYHGLPDHVWGIKMWQLSYGMRGFDIVIELRRQDIVSNYMELNIVGDEVDMLFIDALHQIAWDEATGGTIRHCRWHDKMPCVTFSICGNRSKRDIIKAITLLQYHIVRWASHVMLTRIYKSECMDEYVMEMTVFNQDNLLTIEADD